MCIINQSDLLLPITTITKVTLRDLISVRHEAHEHVAKENLWVFQKP